jgi:hypothetical protein
VPSQYKRQLSQPRPMEQARPTEQTEQRTTTEPKTTTEQRSLQPDYRETQRPVEQLPKTAPEVNQREVTPRQETPGDKNLPPERAGSQTGLEKPSSEKPGQETQYRNDKNGIPPNKVQTTKGVVPPNQAPRQPAGAVQPQKPAPEEKPKDTDHVQDHP